MKSIAMMAAQIGANEIPSSVLWGAIVVIVAVVGAISKYVDDKKKLRNQKQLDELSRRRTQEKQQRP